MEDFVNKFAEVRYDELQGAMIVKFLGFTPHSEFIKIVEAEYEMIQHYNLKKCIIDIRLLPLYATGIKEYVKDIWFPNIEKFGMEYAAYVVPESSLGQIGMNAAHKEAQTNTLTTNYFKDLESAQKWIVSCK